jgi:hypothetical protein
MLRGDEFGNGIAVVDPGELQDVGSIGSVGMFGFPTL